MIRVDHVEVVDDLRRDDVPVTIDEIVVEAPKVAMHGDFDGLHGREHAGVVVLLSMIHDREVDGYRGDHDLAAHVLHPGRRHGGGGNHVHLCEGHRRGSSQNGQ